MPVFAAFFMLATLSSIGLPLLNGFVGEFLILLGAFEFNYVYAALGATGIILGAVYMLTAYQKVMFGPLDKQENKVLRDINLREILVLLPIAVMMFVMGIFPKPFLSRMEPSVEALLQNKFPNMAVVRKLGDERPREARSYPESPE
jgi:NADH-quinone oxidoreductase subunit M